MAAGANEATLKVAADWKMLALGDLVISIGTSSFGTSAAVRTAAHRLDTCVDVGIDSCTMTCMDLCTDMGLCWHVYG